MSAIEKVVVVTKATALEGLITRFNTREQARFYVEHMGTDFAEYEAAHETYHKALSNMIAHIPGSVRTHIIDRAFLPTYTFGEGDLILTMGPDGLVVNVAKYLGNQPLLAVNPDPGRIDGVLIPFDIARAGVALKFALQNYMPAKLVSMARVQLNDGQEFHAVNDFFIGQRTHVSARYKIAYGQRQEAQSSSGIIVSTGAGSTGWLRSVVTGAERIGAAIRSNEPKAVPRDCRFDWEDEHLVFSVREPFISRTSRADLVYGEVEPGEALTITSQMPENGVIFSDGVEEDYVEFNSGAIAQVSIAQKKLRLLVSG